MSDEANVLKYLKASLADDRCLAAKLDLKELMIRDDKANPHRLKVNGAEIKTVEELIPLLTEVEIHPTIRGKFNQRGVVAYANNTHLTITSHPKDMQLIGLGGVGNYCLGFTLVPWEDNDTVLKLKLVGIVLKDMEV